MIHYWNADDLGVSNGVERLFISRNEIVKTLKELLIKKIGHRCTTYIFVDL